MKAPAWVTRRRSCRVVERRRDGTSGPRGRTPPALALASLSLSRQPGSGPAGRAGRRSGPGVPTFPASLPPPGPSWRPGPMSAERREREAARSARPSPGAPAVAPALRWRPGTRRPLASPGLAAGSPRALGRKVAEEAGAGRGRDSRLPKMRDGSRAARQPLLPHHGLHLPAPAQPAPGHPA